MVIRSCSSCFRERRRLVGKGSTFVWKTLVLRLGRDLLKPQGNIGPLLVTVVMGDVLPSSARCVL